MTAGADGAALAGVDALRDLLARGADPDAAGRNEYGPVSALYGASGVVRDPARTRALLEAGATPDDNDSLYHATEAADTTCLRILLEFDANPACTNALGDVPLRTPYQQRCCAPATTSPRRCAGSGRTRRSRPPISRSPRSPVLAAGADPRCGSRPGRRPRARRGARRRRR